MPSTIDIFRPQGSTANLVFNIVDDEGNVVDITGWTNFELHTYINPAVEYDRTVTFTESVGGTFSEDIRVIVGDNRLVNEVNYLPSRLSTDKHSVLVYRGHENKFRVVLNYDGAPLELSRFNRFQLVGVNTDPIDSTTHTSAFDWNNGNGELIVDIGDIAERAGTFRTTLIGHLSSSADTIVLWDSSMNDSKVTVSVIDA